MVGFSKANAKRIAASTVYVERLIKNGPPRRGNGLGQRTEGFLAQLTAQDGYKYSWVAVKHDEDGYLIQEPDYGTGDSVAPVDPEEQHKGYAIESYYRSQYCVIGDVVYLRPSRENDFYVFDYFPEVKIAYTTSEITALNEMTLGKGEAKIYWVEKKEEDSESTDETISDIQPDIRKPPEEGEPALEALEPVTSTVFNPFSSEVDSDSWIQIEYSNGIWLITAADCGA